MTPERYAKREPVRFFNGGLQVPYKVGISWEIIQPVEPEPNNPLYRPASVMQLDAHAGTPDWFAMQMWLVEMEGLSETHARLRTRKGRAWGSITAPYPPVTAAPMTVPAYANFGQSSPDSDECGNL